ncbi:MAG: DUF86 domain-containing protein [Prevotellaceae bacterium]|jgi:uncharacterized protein with HEPN domain|nr:DUF86 domain-containing protein [Prevotellaceae bacterium]
MYDKTRIIDLLCSIEKSLLLILEQTKTVKSVNDFITTPSGVFMLDAVCMNLLSVGEAIKNIDKQTDRKLLSNYPSVPWKDIMGMRDKIAHHYFEIDADAIFDILRHDLPPLLSVIKQVKEDIITSCSA